MNEYALGFLFSEPRGVVALIEKNRPDWQAGLLNGLGGSVEAYETPLEAMQREFREEAGVDVDSWKQFATLRGKAFNIHCFRAFSNDVYNCITATDEWVRILSILKLPGLRLAPHVSWLIPMALSDLEYCNISL